MKTKWIYNWAYTEEFSFELKKKIILLCVLWTSILLIGLGTLLSHVPTFIVVMLILKLPIFQNYHLKRKLKSKMGSKGIGWLLGISLVSPIVVLSINFYYVRQLKQQGLGQIRFQHDEPTGSCARGTLTNVSGLDLFLPEEFLEKTKPSLPLSDMKSDFITVIKSQRTFKQYEGWWQKLDLALRSSKNWPMNEIESFLRVLMIDSQSIGIFTPTTQLIFLSNGNFYRRYVFSRLGWDFNMPECIRYFKQKNSVSLTSCSDKPKLTLTLIDHQKNSPNHLVLIQAENDALETTRCMQSN